MNLSGDDNKMGGFLDDKIERSTW